MQTAIIIQPGETIEEARREQLLKRAGLKFMQDCVKGCIERVPHFSRIKINNKTYRCEVWCNEEGKLHNMPVNITATFMWGSSQAVLVGPILILINGVLD